MVAVRSRCVVLRIGGRVAVVLCGLALSACAHQRSAGNPGSAFIGADATLPRQVGSGPLFDGQARAATGSSLLQAESSLKIEPENLFGTAPATGPRNRLARQSFTQQLSSSIPTASAAPIGLSYRQTRQMQWWLNTDAGATSLRQAQLNWAPAPLRLNLSWSRNQSAVQPVLDCGIEGAVGFAAADQGPGVLLRGRNCSVFAARLPTVDAARDWSAALTWPRRRLVPAGERRAGRAHGAGARPVALARAVAAGRRHGFRAVVPVADARAGPGSRPDSR